MTLSEYIKENVSDVFAATPVSDCAVTLERLIADAPDAPLYAVMTAVPYPHDGRYPLASFARVRDYHLFFASFEEEVRALLREKYEGAYVKVFSDHSPIDERRAAVTAGLGVIGDNGLFISEKYGSFVFLGEIICSLTEEELEAEGVPVVSGEKRECLHCGLCRAACPAGCIGGDKSRCVSALTQKKGDLSDTECDIIRMSGYAWGCDICAEVCPMNEGKDAEYKEFFRTGRISPASFSDLDGMSGEEYGTYPFSWRKKEVMRRNFAIIGKDGSDD